MNISNHFENYFKGVSETLQKLDIQSIESVVDDLLSCREKGAFIYIFGNGGSAANASHIAGDFLKGISYGLEKRFKIICLNDNIAGTTAITNDLSYDEVFVEQLKTFLSPNDLVIGISGSGNSENVVRALEYAKSRHAKTIAMCGFKGGRAKEIADSALLVPVNDMEITEDIHIIIFHAIKQKIIRKLKGENYSMGSNYDNRVKD
ncbi:MAG: SIS domain-containing protein [Bacteroidales bacterium]|nr:SIS domain-containing protein [Bacteroidales bacterium]